MLSPFFISDPYPHERIIKFNNYSAIMRVI